MVLKKSDLSESMNNISDAGGSGEGIEPIQPLINKEATNGKNQIHKEN